MLPAEAAGSTADPVLHEGPSSLLLMDDIRAVRSLELLSCVYLLSVAESALVVGRYKTCSPCENAAATGDSFTGTNRGMMGAVCCGFSFWAETNASSLERAVPHAAPASMACRSIPFTPGHATRGQR
jgi:hypothetical protein